MKSQIKKLIALVACLCLVLPMSVYFAAANDAADANYADFDTIVTSNANGDSSYTKTFTTTNGWVTEYCAIQSGGTTDMNPQFTVIGPDNTHKAVCLNGKVSAPGKITSPTLTGGISKLTINYTKMFTDTKLGADITITDLATGTVYTNQLAKEADKNTKYEVWTYEWALETPISGDFKIEILNNSPTQQTGNKDRLTILDLIWDAYVAPENPVSPEATISFADVANRTSCTTEQQVWAQNGITVTNDKAASKTNVSDKYSNPARFYQGSSLTVAYPGITKIVFNTNDYKDYATPLSESITTGTVAVDGQVVTVTLDEAVDSFFIEGLVAQVRMDSIVVNPAEGGGDTPDTPDTPVVPDEPEKPDTPATDGVATEYKEGVAYKLGLNQTSKGAIYYFTGAMSGYYGATDTDVSKAVDMYVEIVDGGYKLYFNGDAGKQYIKLTQSGTHYNFTFGAEASVFSLDTEKNAFHAMAGDTDCYMGTYGSYVTVGTLKAVQDTDYIARLYTVAGQGGETPDTPDTPVDPEPEKPDTPATDGVATEYKEGVAYKLGLDQTSKGAVYYFTGTMSGYYGATDTDVSKAVDMYVEIVDGGYKLYFNGDAGKQYIKLTQSGTHYNFTFGAEASVFSLDTEKNAFHAMAGDTDCYMGTYGSYVTVGTLKAVQDTDYIARLYTVAGQGGDTPDTPDTPVDPEPEKPELPAPSDENTLSVKEAIDLGLSHEKNTYTEEKYYVTGEIAAFSSTVYGNMYIKDANDNMLFIYGMYDATGEIRYDAMETQPVVGDTVTVYGVVGTYNGTEAQMKNVWLIDLVKGEGKEPENTDPAADSKLSVKEAIDLGLSKLHNIFTENKYYVTGEITEIYNEEYGNMRITDAEGNILTIYGSYDAEGNNRFDAMETKPVVGDVITVYGIIGQYNNTPQVKNGWITAINPTEDPADPENPADPEAPADPEDGDKPEDTDPMGENTTGIVVAVILLVLAAAAVVVTAKKRS